MENPKRTNFWCFSLTNKITTECLKPAESSHSDTWEIISPFFKTQSMYTFCTFISITNFCHVFCMCFIVQSVLQLQSTHWWKETAWVVDKQTSDQTGAEVHLHFIQRKSSLLLWMCSLAYIRNEAAPWGMVKKIIQNKRLIECSLLVA